MRIAVVASLAIHAVLVARLASRMHAPAPRAPELPTLVPAPTSPPLETLVTVVLLDEPAPAHAPAKHAHATPHAPNPAPAPAAPTPALASAAPAPTPASLATSGTASTLTSIPPPALAIRQLDLPPAQIDAPAPAPSHPAQVSELRPSGHGTYTTDLGGSDWHDRTATAHVARDGTVHFDNAPDFEIHIQGLGLAGKFNLDDWIARKAGIDPYASAKLDYLDRTRNERFRIADLNRITDLAHSAIAMQRNLRAARAIPDPTARKQALFELWDDVAEDGDGDVALVQAGADARRYLVGAIRAMRPALEFTPPELAQLNAHSHSRAVFSPYE